MKTLRNILILALLVIVLIFAFQNSQPVKVDFLVWQWQISRAFVIFLSFGLGLLVGIISARIR